MRARILVGLAILSPWILFFGPGLVSGRRFLFRDAAHYYEPLFAWLSQQWQYGRVPTWNSLENLGSPVLAETSSSVLYPAKLLFALPIDFSLANYLYVVLHVLWAALGVYLLTRSLRCSRWGAALAGISYAYGGNVLFQYCNVVFLVGAAWLPWGIWAADQMLRRRKPRSAIGLAVVLALMVLGGDPQMAYHTGLASGLYAALLWRRQRKRKPLRQATTGTRLRNTSLLRNRGWLLLAAGVLGGCLAAVQILPAAGWTRQSTRASYDQPRNVYEAAAEGRLPSQLWKAPTPGTHQDHIYQFSVSPWRLGELVWPNVSGRLFPTHRRWIHCIPAEGRTWTPSLYLGLLPLMLALSIALLRQGPVWCRWSVWLAILFLLGAFGWYGFGWIALEVHQALGGDVSAPPELGPATGGLYWWLVALLPGYAYFRYPAKLLVVAALAVSCLAARGTDRLASRPCRGLRRALLATAAASALLLIAVALTQTWWEPWLAALPADPHLGPIDVAGVRYDILSSFLHALLLSGLGYGSLWLTERIGRPSLRAPLLVALTSIDLMVAHHWMIARGPDVALPLPAVIHTTGRVADPQRLFRGRPAGWQPSAFATSSPQRLRGMWEWDRATLVPKYPLPAKIAMLDSHSSIASAEYRSLLRVARRHGFDRGDGVREPDPAVLEMLHTDWLVLPKKATLHLPRQVYSLSYSIADNARLFRTVRPGDRAWVVFAWESAPPPTGFSPQDLDQCTESQLYREGKLIDFRQRAVLESGPPSPTVPGSSAEARAEVLRDQGDLLEVEVSLAAPGLLVLSDLYADGWIAEVHSEGAAESFRVPCERVNRVLRGVRLPAGDHRVTMRYRPPGLAWGWTITAASLLLLLAGGVWSAARRMLRRRLGRRR